MSAFLKIIATATGPGRMTDRPRVGNYYFLKARWVNTAEIEEIEALIHKEREDNGPWTYRPVISLYVFHHDHWTKTERRYDIAAGKTVASEDAVVWDLTVEKLVEEIHKIEAGTAQTIECKCDDHMEPVAATPPYSFTAERDGLKLIQGLDCFGLPKDVARHFSESALNGAKLEKVPGPKYDGTKDVVAIGNTAAKYLVLTPDGGGTPIKVRPNSVYLMSEPRMKTDLVITFEES